MQYCETVSYIDLILRYSHLTTYIGTFLVNGVFLVTPTASRYYFSVFDKVVTLGVRERILAGLIFWIYDGFLLYVLWCAIIFHMVVIAIYIYVMPLWLSEIK
jgi:hypothetical protein